MFQAFHLVDELSAVENVELPALLLGDPRRDARERATELPERLGVDERADHLPDQLSGGERQRVAVARALVNDPLVVLADEPTGNLDSRATGEILALFAGLREDRQTLLVVTHDARVAATADRLLSMRDGAIVGQTRLDARDNSPGRWPAWSTWAETTDAVPLGRVTAGVAQPSPAAGTGGAAPRHPHHRHRHPECRDMAVRERRRPVGPGVEGDQRVPRGRRLLPRS